MDKCKVVHNVESYMFCFFNSVTQLRHGHQAWWKLDKESAIQRKAIVTLEELHRGAGQVFLVDSRKQFVEQVLNIPEIWYCKNNKKAVFEKEVSKSWS